MREYLEKAVNGWLNIHVDGKLLFMLFVAIGILWWYRKRLSEQTFLIYATLITVACTFPLSAALLMVYQTKFYDYPWIWSMVPVTAAIAYGITVCIREIWAEFKIEKKQKVITAAAFVVILILCGIKGFCLTGEPALSEDASRVVETLNSMDPNANMVWAPKEIITALRQESGIKVLYGRNMWNEALSAYSYDVYDEDTKACFAWMEWAGGYDKTLDASGEEALKYLDGVECGRYAKKMGVTVIVLPEGFDTELAELMQQDLGIMSQQIGGYYLIYCNLVL